MKPCNFTSFIIHGIGEFGYSPTNAHGGYVSPIDGKEYNEPVRIVFNQTEQDACIVAQTYEEESVLFVDQDRNAHLVFQDGSTQPLGKFKRFQSHIKSHCEAIQRGYTRFNGHTYICV